MVGSLWWGPYVWIPKREKQGASSRMRTALFRARSALKQYPVAETLMRPLIVVEAEAVGQLGAYNVLQKLLFFVFKFLQGFF